MSTSDSTLEMQLNGINDKITSSLVDVFKIKCLTPIQVATLPHILSGRDVLAKAKTGTGKTLAFLIPTVQRVLSENSVHDVKFSHNMDVDPVRALILSSTRELANQIVKQAEMLTQNISQFNVDCVLGGTSINPQRERLDRNSTGQNPYGGIVDIMIATPGRLVEHIESTPGFESRLCGVKVLILDEVDQLLDAGFQRNIEFIISKLSQGTDRQTLCFSATVPERLRKVLGVAMHEDHVVVDCVGVEDTDTHAKIEQSFLVHPLEDSMLAFFSSIKEEMNRRPDDYKIIAFLPTARQTQFSTAVLTELGLEVMEIHSRKNQAQRTAASNAFRAARSAILLSSDVSARGVDYPNITLVLQIGPPASKEMYVQRLGRTGRAGESGAGRLLLCTFERPFLDQLADLTLRDVSQQFMEQVTADQGGTVDAANSQNTKTGGGSEDGKGKKGSAKGVVPSAPRCISEGSLAARVRTAASRVDDSLATQTYSAWLKSYNGTSRKLFKWSKQDMVNNANLFALEVLGRGSVPPLPLEEASMMGLIKGVTGLNIVEGLMSSDFDSATSLDALDAATTEFDPYAPEKEILEMKLDRKLMGLTFRAQAKDIADALMAYSQDSIVALRDDIGTTGVASLSGFDGVTITADMVSFHTKKPDGPRSISSRSTSAASMQSSASAAGLRKGITSSGSLAGFSRVTSSASLASFPSDMDLTAIDDDWNVGGAPMSAAGSTAPPAKPAAPTAEEFEIARARVSAAGEQMRVSKGDQLLNGAAHKELLAAKSELKRLNALAK